MGAFGNSGGAAIQNDEIVSQLFKDGKIELEQFTYVAKAKFDFPGQQIDTKLAITGTQFLLRNIEIYGHSNMGNLFNAAGQSVEPFKFNIVNNNTGQAMFGDEVDISAYCGATASQTAATFTPSVLDSHTELDFRIRHIHIPRWEMFEDGNGVIDTRTIPSILQSIPMLGSSAINQANVWVDIVLKGARIRRKD